MTPLIPISYKIHLEPDLKTFQFAGTTEIRFKAQGPIKEIHLNILDLAVWTCKVKIDGEPVTCPFSVNPEKEEIRISLPQETSGEIYVSIHYMGCINDKMAGFYRSSYTKQGEPTYMALTQFEESEARRAFPCVDHPAQKACFDIDMTIDEGLTAISNTPIKEEYPLGNGKKRVSFEQTPLMSTYLLFFSVGEFEFLEDPQEVLVRVATMPGMIKYGSFGLDFGRKSLEYCEDFYGVKYPLAKLDLIAVADFAFGAMENWGAITFRENLLLHYPDITSKAGEQRICEVIAHEMAHQWFGNLVTPSDWKYLWLNESFATYFGYGVVAHYHSEWDVWDQFLDSQTDVALDRDALQETFPIEIPGGDHVVINTSTAPIIYNKGGSILRQIKGYMGDLSFKQGLRHYLKTYQFACASSNHLWEAFEATSQKPISRIMKSWIEQPGYPVVQVDRDGDKLIFTQKRFTYLPAQSDQKWLIPITVQVLDDQGNQQTLSTLLESEQGSLDMGPHATAYKVNAGQTGFYRIKYQDKEALNELGKRVRTRELSRIDRWGLQNDLYALVKGGQAAMDAYVDFLSNYMNEEAFLPLMSIAGNLFHAYLVMEGEKRQGIASIGKSILERVLSRMGYDPDPAERHTTSILRERILFHAVLYGSKPAGDFALNKFQSLMRGAPVHPDIVKGVIKVGALNGDHTVFDWFDKRLQTSDSEHERMNLLAALGMFEDKGLIQKAQQYVLDKVPSRNKFIPITSMAASPHAGPLMWDWYTAHVKDLETFHPLHYERVIAGIVPLCGLGREGEVKAFFKNYLAQNSQAADAIKVALERLEIYRAMRSREG